MTPLPDWRFSKESWQRQKPERTGIKGCKHSAHKMKTWKPSFARVQTPELCVEAVFFTSSTRAKLFAFQFASIRRCLNCRAINVVWNVFGSSVQAIRFLTLPTGDVSEPTNVDAADCCGCQSTLLQLHRRGNLPRTKCEAVCLPVSQAFAGVSTS